MNVLVIDTETAPTQADVWQLFDVTVGINQIRKPGHLLCFSAAWLDRPDNEIIFDAEWESGHGRMIKHLHALYSDADAVISYNGVKFDNKIANTEFVLAGLGPPPPYRNIDLLQTVRRRFRLASNKLDYVTQQFDLGRKVSHPGHGLWRQCELGDPEARALMRTYNTHDVLLTKHLYRRLQPWLTTSPNMGNYSNEPHACPNCGSTQVQQRGYARNIANSYKRYQCQKCGTWSRAGRTEHSTRNRAEILRAIT